MYQSKSIKKSFNSYENNVDDLSIIINTNFIGTYIKDI